MLLAALAYNLFLGLFITLFVIVSLLLILLILFQKGREGGLASAFGGGGGNTAFGSKTGDVLTWATSIVFGVFLLLGAALHPTANEVDKRARPAGTTTTVGNTRQTPGGPGAPAQGGTTSTPQV